MGVIENDLNEDTYIGLELPLDVSSEGIFKRTKTALQQAKSNIKNLLMTRKGERLGNPEFGSELLAVIFEQEGEDVEIVVEEAIRSAMSQWLPFIIIDEIETNFSERNIKSPIINISDGKLSLIETQHANVISFKFLLDSFKEYFEDEQEAQKLLEFVKNKRTFTNVSSIKRIYNKE